MKWKNKPPKDSKWSKIFVFWPRPLETENTGYYKRYETRPVNVVCFKFIEVKTCILFGNTEREVYREIGSTWELKK
jgi:hypothetical protein